MAASGNRLAMRKTSMPASRREQFKRSQGVQMSEPSSLMLEAFERMGCGAPSLTCWCGRDHHAPASDFIEPAEEAQMRSSAREHPDSVQLHDGDGVSAMMIQGQLVVHGCKCNWLGKLEAIIWDERESILKYYKLRREAAAKEAQSLSAALGEINGR